MFPIIRILTISHKKSFVKIVLGIQTMHIRNKMQYILENRDTEA